MGTELKGRDDTSISIREDLVQRHNVFMRKSLQNVRLAQSRDGEALALRGVVRLDALQRARVLRVFFRRLEDFPVDAFSHSFFVVVGRPDVAERPGFSSVFQGAQLVALLLGCARSRCWRVCGLGRLWVYAVPRAT